MKDSHNGDDHEAEPRYLWALPDLIDAVAKVIRREGLGGLLHQDTHLLAADDADLHLHDDAGLRALGDG